MHFKFRRNPQSQFHDFPVKIGNAKLNSICHRNSIIALKVVLRDIVEGIIPAKGKWSSESSLEAPVSYEIEPSAHDVLGALIPRLISISLYHMLLEAKASEHSARMVAMKNASDTSKEMTRDLTRLFNKIRQANITREVSEIVGGREALAT